MHEAGSEQPPPLVGSDGGGAEVGASAVGVEERGRGDGDAAGAHGQEDQSVDGDERVGDGVDAARVRLAAV